MAYSELVPPAGTSFVVGDKWRAAVEAEKTRLNFINHESRIGAVESGIVATGLAGVGASVDKEIVLYDGTTGKATERATGTGFVRVSSGIFQTPTGVITLAELPSTLGQILRTTTIINNTDLKALPAGTPYIVAAAPGAGLYYNFHRAIVQCNASAGAYTNLNADAYAGFQINGYDMASYLYNETASGTTFLTKLFGFARRSRASFLPYMMTDDKSWGATTFVDDSDFVTDFANNPLVFYLNNNSGGNLTGGNVANTTKIYTYFSIEAV